ncbi:hypothetical protein HYH03_000903 [Edaphochlamys debaryana]|uniref:Uncharacterized protein n=1 Tax=Edaphochlamys debaryana TaxID=47281 RepID=A0A836C5P2_9CHLO|nr:hypothetical protein HYH03_000903 [Edaphochlamys debaryana]|eukprot:KAG2501085.1 hypothetical protein HYH03_000903 [Edaphochlamys debaryana]
MACVLKCLRVFSCGLGRRALPQLTRALTALLIGVALVAVTALCALLAALTPLFWNVFVVHALLHQAKRSSEPVGMEADPLPCLLRNASASTASLEDSSACGSGAELGSLDSAEAADWPCLDSPEGPSPADTSCPSQEPEPAEPQPAPYTTSKRAAATSASTAAVSVVEPNSTATPASAAAPSTAASSAPNAAVPFSDQQTPSLCAAIAAAIHYHALAATPEGARDPLGLPINPVPPPLCLQPGASAAFTPAPGARLLGGPAPGEPTHRPFVALRATVQQGTLALSYPDGTQLRIPAGRKVITLPLGAAKTAKPAPRLPALAARAASLLSAEPCAFAVRDGALAEAGGQAAVFDCALPLLAWTVSEPAGRPDAIDLVLYTGWGEGGDLEQVLDAAMRPGALGLDPDDDALQALLFPGGGPVVDWGAVFSCLLGSLRLLGAVEGADLVHTDAKLANMVQQAGRVKLIDPPGSARVASVPSLLAAGLPLDAALTWHRLQGVRAECFTPLLGPPEAFLRRGKALAEGLARDQPGCEAELRRAEAEAPGLVVLVAIVLAGQQAELDLGLGGMSYFCMASHIYLWARSLLLALEGCERRLARRAAAAGWGGVGPANAAALGCLRGLAAQCLAPLPSQRPTPAAVAEQLAARMKEMGLLCA